MKRLLLIEDDDNLGFVIQDQLMAAGFEVEWIKDGNQVIEVFETFQPSLCLLDVMLPGNSGFDISETIRTHGIQVPILFLTARDMVEDRIRGFKSGGDDYITKPFSMEELILRIRVFLNRSNPDSKFDEINSNNYSFSNFSIDFKNQFLEIDSKKKSLTEKETMIFKLLILCKDRILKREEILLKIWGDDDYFMGRSLDVFISRIRKYLSGTPISIKTHHSQGFKWEESE